MASVITDNKYYSEIADAIRYKRNLNSASTFYPSQMATAIGSINVPSGYSAYDFIYGSLGGNAREWPQYTYTNNEVSYIGSYAFTSFTNNLRMVTFENCSFIGQYAFSGCNRLSYVSFPKCRLIESHAFD